MGSEMCIRDSYMGLELQSLALYVLATFNRDQIKSTEAGLKYFVLSALSSGLLLYGCSLIYGFTGSTNFNVIAEQLNSNEYALTFGIVFILSCLAVPTLFFGFYPDPLINTIEVSISDLIDQYNFKLASKT